MSDYTPLASFRFTGAVRDSKIGEPTCAICGAQPASMVSLYGMRAETRCEDHNPLNALADLISEEILSMSDDEVRAELIEEGLDPDEEAERVRRLADRAVAYVQGGPQTNNGGEE